MVRVSPKITTVKENPIFINQPTIAELYKNLEVIDYQRSALREQGDENFVGVSLGNDKIKSPARNKQNILSQVHVFREAMKVVYVAAQFLGLMPISGLLKNDVTQIRFSFLSWRYVYSMCISVPHVIFTVLCFYSLITNRVTISTLLFTCFYASTSVSCIFFLRLSIKWPALIKKLLNARIDEYTDTNVIKKCIVISVMFLSISAGTYLLRVIDRISMINDCYPNSTNIVKLYCNITYRWLFELDFAYNNLIIVFLIPLNILAVVTWSFPDLFIACISLYLSSIIKEVNKKIIATENKCPLSTYWKCLREDYNRVADIVRSFDEVINGLIFSSFTNNLFFACFHVFYLLSNGVNMSSKLISGSCPNYPSGPLSGYEHSVYYITSLFFILMRLLLVALLAAEVNTASLTAAPYLYNVPSTIFCSEVERFINQIQGDVVALSGLKFFYVTREFVLSIVGTIITYELVLLQLNGDLIEKN